MDAEAGERLRAYMEPRIRDALLPWSERHGIGRDTIYALWRGREPRAETMRRIADALGVSYDELVAAREGRQAEIVTEAGDVIGVLREELRETREMFREVLLQLAPAPRSTEALEDWAGEERRKHEGTPTQLPISDPARHAQE